MTQSLHSGIELATPAELQVLIERVFNQVAARPEYCATWKQIVPSIAEGTYPIENGEDTSIIPVLGPIHTVNLSATLGYMAGMLDNPVLCNTMTTLLQVLEALGQQGLVYGVNLNSTPNLGPHFMVKVQSTADCYLVYTFSLESME